MLGQLTFFLLLQQRFSTISLNAAESRATILLESATKNFNTNQLTRFVLLHYRSLLHKILGVLLKDCQEPHKGFLAAACSSKNSV